MTTFKVSVTSLSQYIRLDNCDRYLKFRIQPIHERALGNRYGVTIQPLTPLLEEEGKRFEEEVEAALRARGERVVSFPRSTRGHRETRRWLREATDPVILSQARVELQIGRFIYTGYTDLVRLHRDGAGLHIGVWDVKSGRVERTDHRLQVAIYADLLRRMAGEEGVRVATIRGGVIHKGEDGNAPVVDLDNQVFDLSPYLFEFQRLALDGDSVLNRIADQAFEGTDYHLTYRCDGCLYNAICMYDSAARLDLSLVPHLTETEKRVFNSAGIDSVEALAGLMDYGKGRDAAMVPAPGREEVVQALSGRGIGSRLPVIVQRARRVMRRFDGTTTAIGYIRNSGYGTLPKDDQYPDMVRLFIDAQADYLQDRLYLLAALVRGPEGERVVVRHTESSPEASSERALLLSWVGEVVDAVRAVAGSVETILHLYLYNRYDQAVLLEALKRHLDSVALLPGFYDLITQHPAVTQPVVSFLADEVMGRRNLGYTCQPLHDVARAMGFDWETAEYDFYHLFRARMFDNRRTVLRTEDGQFQPPPRDEEGQVRWDEEGVIRIESAARFNSQIPLEYAYAAWGALPDRPGRLLDPYRPVTWRELAAFAQHRVRALAHIEANIRPKAYIDKAPISLTTLASGQTQASSLALSLRAFLLIEHYVRLQERLQVYALPISRRVQSGRALLMRLDHYDAARGLHRFTIEHELAGVDAGAAANILQFNEGDWGVVNIGEAIPLHAGSDRSKRVPTGGKIKHGRLASIHAIGDDWIELKLLRVSWSPHNRFSYFHTTTIDPLPGRLYTLDEMADDPNGDKMWEALADENVAGNVLYRWLSTPPLPRPTPPVDSLADMVNHVEGHPLTPEQRGVVAGRLADPLFLMQGPPGTGKSFTSGWAIITRLIHAAAEGRPFRVAVTAHTHPAILIVLQEVVEKWGKLSGHTALPPLRIVKVTNSPDDTMPDGVEPIVPYDNKEVLEQMLATPYLIVGATPGGLYNVARHRGVGEAEVDWGAAWADLLVIDEASQMTQPAAVLAGGWLREDGQALVVGDHRQMPPILAHDWEEEKLRTALFANPHLSIFEALLERGAPRVVLTESFRLHRILAELLQDNIYIQDGIEFFSRRTALMATPPAHSPMVDAILDPDYPLVTIEHDEATSQRYNELELEILNALIGVCVHQMEMNGRTGLGVVVPHRAQRALAQSQFPTLADAGAIDTVERFQGNQRNVIILSATVSDPAFLRSERDFLLNLQRLNVALSRARVKLIVIASRSIISLLTSDLDTYENAIVWKKLFAQYADTVLWQGEVGGVRLRVRGRHAEAQ